MEYNYEHNFNFESPINNIAPDQLISQSLSNVSTGEIQSFFNRISFYMEHFNIVHKRQKSTATENKVNFLKKLHTALKTEISSREQTASTY